MKEYGLLYLQQTALFLFFRFFSYIPFLDSFVNIGSQGILIFQRPYSLFNTLVDTIKHAKSGSETESTPQGYQPVGANPHRSVESPLKTLPQSSLLHLSENPMRRLSGMWSRIRRGDRQPHQVSSSSHILIHSNRDEALTFAISNFHCKLVDRIDHFDHSFTIEFISSPIHFHFHFHLFYLLPYLNLQFS